MNESRQLAAINVYRYKRITPILMEVNEVEANKFRRKMVRSVNEHVAAHLGRVVKI